MNESHNVRAHSRPDSFPPLRTHPCHSRLLVQGAAALSVDAQRSSNARGPPDADGWEESVRGDESWRVEQSKMGICEDGKGGEWGGGGRRGGVAQLIIFRAMERLNWGGRRVRARVLLARALGGMVLCALWNCVDCADSCCVSGLFDAPKTGLQKREKRSALHLMRQIRANGGAPLTSSEDADATGTTTRIQLQELR